MVVAPGNEVLPYLLSFWIVVIARRPLSFDNHDNGLCSILPKARQGPASTNDCTVQDALSARSPKRPNARLGPTNWSSNIRQEALRMHLAHISP